MKVLSQQKIDALKEVIWVDKERMSGVPCFYGTRVPVQNLFDFLEGGDTLEEFLENFPGVTREQAIRVLNLAKDELFEALSF